jgi:hypothetical protein
VPRAVNEGCERSEETILKESQRKRRRGEGKEAFVDGKKGPLPHWESAVGTFMEK